MSRFQWQCSWFVVAGLAWLIVCDNYSLNTFSYRLPLVIWLIYCLQEILSESISKILPIIKKFNTPFTCCIAYVVWLISWLLFSRSIVCIGVSPPQKQDSFFFVKSPIRSANCPSPLLRQSSLYFGFSMNSLLPKNQIFQWSPIMLKCFIVSSHYIL